MQHATPVFCEHEAVAAPAGLVMYSINGKASVVTEQKSADCTVADEEYIACSITS